MKILKVYFVERSWRVIPNSIDKWAEWRRTRRCRKGYVKMSEFLIFQNSSRCFQVLFGAVYREEHLKNCDRDERSDK